MKTEDKIELFYKNATPKELYYALFGMGISYAKKQNSLEWCKKQIAKIIEINMQTNELPSTEEQKPINEIPDVTKIEWDWGSYNLPPEPKQE